MQKGHCIVFQQTQCPFPISGRTDPLKNYSQINTPYSKITLIDTTQHFLLSFQIAFVINLF